MNILSSYLTGMSWQGSGTWAGWKAGFLSGKWALKLGHGLFACCAICSFKKCSSCFALKHYLRTHGGNCGCQTTAEFPDEVVGNLVSNS